MRIVAEIGLQHCGCVGTAHAFIDAIADAGADSCKFQCHTGDPTREFRPGATFYDASRAEYWRRTAFTPDEWAKLRQHAKDRGLAFGVSCFSLAAFEMMRPLKPDFWKVPSGLVSNPEYIVALANTEAPVVLSSGMSSMEELQLALGALVAAHCREVTVLQCSSEYPVAPERIGLNLLSQWRSGVGVYHTNVGLSDHSGRPWAGLAAAALGADMLEIHVAWHRSQWGPDVSASITIDELKMLVEGVRWIETAMQHPVDKDVVVSDMEAMRSVFMPRGMIQ